MSKKRWIIIAAQVLLIAIILVGGALGRKESYEFDQQDFSVSAGAYDTAKQEFYISGDDGNQVTFLTVPEISLAPGVYRVDMTYETDNDSIHRCYVEDEEAPYESVFSNGTVLYAGLDKTDFRLWTLCGTKTLKVKVDFGGKGYLGVKGLTIIRTSDMSRMIAASLMLLFAFLDFCLYIWDKDRRKLLDKESKTVIFGLAVVVIFASAPLFIDSMTVGADMSYHMMRIEGVLDSILQGQFPCKIAPEWQFGYGYADPVFYCPIFLYIPAFFRLMGFTVQASYKILLFFINLATAIISYKCYRDMSGRKYIGLVASILYTMSIGRSYKMYSTGGMSECLAMIFLPLIACGFYLLFTESDGKDRYKKSYVMLTAGFTGIVMSHWLTCEMVGVFTLILLIIEIRKVFRKETFLTLVKTVATTLLLTAWFLVPFLDYEHSGNFVIENVSGRKIEMNGLSPANMLLVFIRLGANGTSEGVLQSYTLGIGAVFLVVLLLFLYLAFVRSREEHAAQEKQLMRAGWICTGLGIAAMIMTMYLFPWDLLQSLGEPWKTFVSMIQYPARYLSIAITALTTLAVIIMMAFYGAKDRKYAAWLLAGLGVIGLLSGIYYINDIMYVNSTYKLYNEEGMGAGYISGGEYLPYGTDPSLLTYRGAQAGEGVTITDYEKNGIHVSLTCKNTSTSESYIDLPLLMYKGYRLSYNGKVQALGTAGQEKAGQSAAPYLTTGTNSSVRIVVPAGAGGQFEVYFKELWYWRLAELVSFVTLVLCIAGWKFTKHRTEKTDIQK